MDEISQRRPLLPGWTVEPEPDKVWSLEDEEAKAFAERISAGLPARPVPKPPQSGT